jgi:hypothetical protein
MALSAPALIAQTPAAPPQKAPLTSEEFLHLVRQLQKRPGLKDEIIKEVRMRGIDFTLTSGMRSLVATRSGNDPELRRVLEEAERRFRNPDSVPPASDAESTEVLEKARTATREAAGGMPDFVVKQLILRAYAYGMTKNWVPQDRLVVGVSYRASGGEKYKLLAQNGIPVPTVEEKNDYVEAGGSSSTGEFVTLLSLLFADETQTKFKPSGTDTLRGRRTIVYDYNVKQPNSKHTLTYNRERSVVVGYSGRVWIDRENFRVLKVESVATDIPSDFPITATTNTVDYEWVTIPGQGDYLLPSRAIMEMTAMRGRQVQQSRNDIRFRGYQKYGSEVKIIEEDIIDEEEAPKETPKKKP